MPISVEKSGILREYRYVYNFDRGLYYNKKEGKIFSEEVIDDNTTAWLKEKITQEKNEQWKFYTTKPLRPELEDTIIKELEK